MQLFKDLFYLGIIRDWVQFTVRLLKPVVDTFTPPKPFSWQVLFWLSVFSAVVSLLIESPLISSFVGQIGWIFLTLSVVWATQGLTFSFLGWTFRPGSWIGGAFIAWLLYFWNHTSFAFALTVWPIISAVISTIPRFLDLQRGQVFKLPNVAYRQQLVTLYLTAMVISCWFGFHFLVQEWLTRYPSLALDDMYYSAFVVKIGQSFAEELPANSVGVSLLSIAEQRLVERLNNQPWTNTERWLIEQQQEQFATFQEQVRSELRLQQRAAEERSAPTVFWKRSPSDAPLQEYPFWSFPTPEVADAGATNEYVMGLATVWTGPSAQQGGYQLTKQCAIAEVQPSRLLPSPSNLLPERFPTTEELLRGQVSPGDFLPNPQDRSPNTTRPSTVPSTSVVCEPTRYFRAT